MRSATKPSELGRLAADPSLRGTAFAGAYSDAVDAWLTGILGATPGVALIAVGSYGRRELCPASDLDVVLLHDGKRSRGLRELAERVWYPIWDAGLALDHSVRTTREALAVADRDLKAALGLLDARLVAGDGDLAAALVRRVREQWLDRARRRVPELDALIVARHLASGDVAYALEPDLKEGKGGSRDLAALRVLATVTPVYTPDDRLVDAAETLFATRVALQRRVGRTERLFLEHQDDVATDLGDVDADALMARVSSAARTIAWQSDDAWWSVRSWIEGPRGRSAAGSDVALGHDVVLRDGEVALLADADVTGDPSLALRVAAASAYLGTRIARPTMRRLESELQPPDVPWSTETRDAFLALLGGGHEAILQFETLDQLGLLARFLPEWDSVRCHSQRNAFHRYTVDRHLLETVAQACALVRRVERPDLLLVGALFHDLGKGTPGDHTSNGVALAADIAARMGFAPGDVNVIVALVQHHLLLPTFATGRDLDDPATIDTVVRVVGSEAVLDLLHALTEADSLATGPTAWTSWKADLVGRLVEATRAALRRHRGAHAAPASLPSDLLQSPTLATFDGTVSVVPGPNAVTIVAPDGLGLLAIEVAVLGVHAQSVRSARTYTVDDIAIGEFVVEPEHGRVPDWDRVAADLRAALADPEPVRDQLEARTRRYEQYSRPMAARPAEPRVLIDNTLTDVATIVEVRAADAMGVLHRIANAFAEHGWRVEQAYVSTLGHEVVDTFYVTDVDGKKLADGSEVASIRGAILDVLAPSGIVQSNDQLR